MTPYDPFRNAVLEGSDDPDLLRHLDECAGCAALAERVRTVRRVAPGLVAHPSGAMSEDIADRVMARLAVSSPRPARGRSMRRGVLPRVAIAAAVLAVVAVAVPIATGDGSEPGAVATADLSDALLVSAQRTEDAGSARLHLTGSAEVRVDGRTIDVSFGGVGALTESRLRYRGLTKVGETMIPCELTVVGPDAWMRRADGSWLHVAEPVGALAPVVLDAGSILELLRLPKDDVRLVADDGSSRTVAFTVAGRPGLIYEIVAVVGRADDLLRTVEIEAVTDDWTTRATMTLYGFGEPVTIRPPAEADVVGTWTEAPAGSMPVRALYPVG